MGLLLILILHQFYWRYADFLWNSKTVKKNIYNLDTAYLQAEHSKQATCLLSSIVALAQIIYMNQQYIMLPEVFRYSVKY